VTTTHNQVEGYAAYFEFIKSDHRSAYVYQLLITPEARMSSGRVLPMTGYRRRLSNQKTRAQWKQFGSSVSSADARTPTADDQVVTDSMLQFLTRTFHSFSVNGYTMRTGSLPPAQPIFVEVSCEDLENIRLGKTPYKILGRVWKSRKALGFPEGFIPELTF
jgi:hypothetical protein